MIIILEMYRHTHTHSIN